MGESDWAKERAREIIGFRDSPPCDCIQLAEYGAFSRCYCHNLGDAEAAATWCAERNMLDKCAAGLREAEARGFSRGHNAVIAELNDPSPGLCMIHTTRDWNDWTVYDICRALAAGLAETPTEGR